VHENEVEMAILITGAAGFVGMGIVRAFTGAGFEVVAMDRVPSEAFQPRAGTALERLTYVVGDVTDQAAFDLLPEGIDGVLHAAALTPGDREREDPDGLLRVNLVGTINALDFARRAPACTRFLYVSSEAAYSRAQPGVLTEKDADGGTTLYGAAKLAAELVVLRMAELSGLDAGVVRPGYVYGPGERLRPSRPFVSQMCMLIESALQGRTVSLADLDELTHWIHVDDVAGAMLAFWSAPHLGGRVFTVGPDEAVSLRTVIATLNEMVPLTVREEPTGATNGHASRPGVISNQAIRRELGWQPRYSLREGMRQYIEELRVPTA
jgi:nucleoside-diphosphate-sugar epimerase